MMITKACATHRNVIAGLERLRRRGVISPSMTATATEKVIGECYHLITERDPSGNCVLRHP